jgi:hypothetical protein
MNRVAAAIDILLATYYGEAFLDCEQIEALANPLAKNEPGEYLLRVAAEG